MSHVCACGFCSPSMMSDGCQHEATLQAVQEAARTTHEDLWAELLGPVHGKLQTARGALSDQDEAQADRLIQQADIALRNAIYRARAALDSLTEAAKCERCDGSGQISETFDHGPGMQGGMVAQCPDCHGSGKSLTEARRSEPDA